MVVFTLNRVEDTAVVNKFIRPFLGKEIQLFQRFGTLHQEINTATASFWNTLLSQEKNTARYQWAYPWLERRYTAIAPMLSTLHNRIYTVAAGVKTVDTTLLLCKDTAIISRLVHQMQNGLLLHFSIHTLCERNYTASDLFWGTLAQMFNTSKVESFLL